MEVGVNQITLNLRGHETLLEIREISTISANTQAIFKELRNVPDCLDYPLSTKAALLRNTIQKLQDAKDHETRNKIFGLLRSALTVAIAVGGILSTIAMTWCPPAAVGIGLATFIGYTAISYYNASRSNTMEIASKQYIGPLFTWIAAPALPIYEEFGKISRLEKSREEQRKELNSKFSDLVSFFSQDQNDLQKKLVEEIEKAGQSLKMLNDLPLATHAGKKEIEEKLKKYSKALEELKRAKAYYSQFQLQA